MPLLNSFTQGFVLGILVGNTLTILTWMYCVNRLTKYTQSPMAYRTEVWQLLALVEALRDSAEGPTLFAENVEDDVDSVDETKMDAAAMIEAAATTLARGDLGDARVQAAAIDTDTLARIKIAAPAAYKLLFPESHDVTL